MYTALILIAGIVLSYISRPTDKKSYQKAVLSIFGIAYFCVWRFSDFYLDVFFADSNIKNISFSVLLLFVALLSQLPFIRSVTPNQSNTLVAVFFLSVVITFSFETDIKNTIAEFGGYYDDPVVVFGNASELTDLNSYYYEPGGFTIDIPAGWKQNTLGPGFDYFELRNDNKLIAELRPGCFHNASVTIPEIINNIKSRDQFDLLAISKQCFILENKSHVCLIRSTGPEATLEKWRWLVTDEYHNQGIEMDILFYSNNASARRDAETMIKSLVITPLAPPLPACLSPAEWL